MVKNEAPADRESYIISNPWNTNELYAKNVADSLKLQQDKNETPVGRALYESYIISNAWNADKLYAKNVADSLRLRQDINHIGHQRRQNLINIDKEIEKLKKTAQKLKNDKKCRCTKCDEINKDKDTAIKTEQWRYNYKIDSSKNEETKAIKADLVNGKCSSRLLVHRPVMIKNTLIKHPARDNLVRSSHGISIENDFLCYTEKLHNSATHKNYSEFYKSHDFSSTKPKCISKGMRTKNFSSNII